MQMESEIFIDPVLLHRNLARGHATPFFLFIHSTCSLSFELLQEVC
jgi:hypothetical protein